VIDVHEADAYPEVGRWAMEGFIDEIVRRVERERGRSGHVRSERVAPDQLRFTIEVD
jgi:hypothetical protein